MTPDVPVPSYTPEKLPKLRIVVEPYQGIYRRWHWRVEQEHRLRKHTWWAQVYDGGYGPIAGYTRDQEKALLKARRAAAKECEWHLRKNERNAGRLRDTIIEPVTCEGEPV